MPTSLKTKLYNQVILPVITYGSETWTLTKESITKLQVAQRAMERQMLRISLRDRKENIWVRGQTKVLDIIESIKWSKWKWAGHIQRMTDERWTKTLTNWRPWYGKRNRGRPCLYVNWRDDIEKVYGVTWKRKTENRKEWKILGEAYVQQWNIG